MNELRPLIDETPRARPIHFRPAQRLDLTIEQILGWADAFHARHDRWPTHKDKRVGLPDTSWAAINTCLREGWRGLNPGSSLAKLLHERRGKRHQHYLISFTANLILTWADAHHTRTGEWPREQSGPVVGAPGETWGAVDAALVGGGRGLPGGSSLAQLLAATRGVRNLAALPPLTPEQILTWADAHHTRTGKWPGQHSGPVVDAPGETWPGVNMALALGGRGLPGGSSLAQLLASRRGVRNLAALPPLTPEQIRTWADTHHDRTGDWPHRDTGPIPEAPGETWCALDAALSMGRRGLPGGTSLAGLLLAERGVRHHSAVPRLEPWEILVWADAHHKRTGKWPTTRSGPIPEAPGETWLAVQTALYDGLRGLPGGESLARLLSRRRDVRNRRAVPPLSIEQILAWADAHRRRSGDWPTKESGSISDAPGETWMAMDRALRSGRRGLPGGSSLAQLLAAQRGARNMAALPPLTHKQILAWADAHHTRTGRWPTNESGAVTDVPDERWSAVDAALRTGDRGLPRGGSLARLLAEHRGKRNHLALPPFTAEQILAWADAHHTRASAWPAIKSGPIPEAPGETWARVDAALRVGARGLRGGDSLARLLTRHRGMRNPNALPPLSIEQITRWVRAHYQRTKCWPRRKDGPIHNSGGETWMTVDAALYCGYRGLPGGSSLAKLVEECRAAE